MTQEEFSITAWGKRIANFLNNEEVSDDAKESMKCLIETGASAASITIAEPELATKVLGLLQDNLNPVYYSALLDSIKAIYDVFSVDDDELEKEIAELRSVSGLDLSKVKPPKEGQCLDLAKLFVAILEHPKADKEIVRSIEDLLANKNASFDSYHDVEYVRSIIVNNLEG